jgi:L-ribulokinase
MIGMEAGQSAFGDVYAWFKKLISWPVEYFVKDENLKKEINDGLIAALSEEAARLPFGEDDELAIDWLNGRRTPDANQLLKGAVTGLDLATDAPRFFRALVEATCFGAKAIVERFLEQGIPVKGLIGLGGVAKKSPYIMQMMADVMNMPIRIHKSEQTCAAGAAMFAATAAGIYNNVEDAMRAMGQGFDATFSPDKTKAEIYSRRYERYKKLGTFIEESC